MEQDKCKTLQTASSLLFREGCKKLSDGYVHAAGGSEAGAECQMLHGLPKYTLLSVLQIKQLTQFLA